MWSGGFVCGLFSLSFYNSLASPFLLRIRVFSIAHACLSASFSAIFFFFFFLVVPLRVSSVRFGGGSKVDCVHEGLGEAQ